MGERSEVPSPNDRKSNTVKLEDFIPGKRVCANLNDRRIEGTVGRSWNAKGFAVIVQFDNGMFIEVKEETIQHFQLLQSN